MSTDVFIVDSIRSAVGRAKRGTLKNMRPETMGAAVVKAAVERIDGLQADQIDDVLIGCAMPEGEQGMNMGRLIAQLAGLPDSVPGATINRFCSSGLQTIAMATQAIAAGHAETVIAGGAESMSMVPMTGYYFSPNPTLQAADPDVFIGMGITAENVAKKYQVSREDQDAFALSSHQKAIRSISEGKFRDEVIPLTVSETIYVDEDTRTIESTFDTDEGPRPDSNLESMAKLRPAFKMCGSVTAANASQMSDGAAATVVMSSEMLKDLNLNPLARLSAFAVAGIAPEIMGVGPIASIPKALKQAGLSLADIGLIELNEAFASQSLAVMRELDINPEIVNVNGGAIALGHPLGCTGAKLTATLLHEMKRRQVRYGICTMCIGGGMGATGIFENLSI